MSSSRALDPRIWLLAVGTFAVGTDAFVIAGILPQLAGAFDVSIEAAGLIVSTYSFTYGVGTPILAAFVARWPRHRVVVATLSVFAAVNICCAMAPGYFYLIALKVAAGICAAIYTPTAYALATAVTSPAKRGAALSAVAIGLSAASVFGVPLGTWVGHAAGWHATFWMIAAITIAGAISLWRWGMPEASAGRHLIPRLAVRIAPLARRNVWLALLPCLILYIGTAAVYTYIALLLGTHYDTADIPALLVVYGLGGLAGSQLGGRLSDRLGPTVPIVIGLGGLIAAQLALPFVLNSTWLTCATLFFATLFSWGCFAPLQARIMRLESDNATVVIALINTGVYLGNAIGAVIGGFLLRYIAVTDLPFVSAFVALIAMASLLLSRR